MVKTILSNLLILLARPARLERATCGFVVRSLNNDLNDLAYLAYQIVVKCVKSWGVSAPQVHPVQTKLHRHKLALILDEIRGLAEYQETPTQFEGIKK